MNIDHLIALARYLISHEKKYFWPPFVLFMLGIVLLSLVHAQHKLPTEGIIAFFSLWGFMQILSVTQSFEEDFQDGTFAYLITEQFSVFSYLAARLVAVIVYFSVPLLMCQFIGLMMMEMDVSLILGLILNHIQLLCGIAGIQLMLCMTARIEKKMTNLLLFIPFWVPSFLYLVGSVNDRSALVPQIGLIFISIGMTLLMVQQAYKWREL
jgi:hypothetical protein